MLKIVLTVLVLIFVNDSLVKINIYTLEAVHYVHLLSNLKFLLRVLICLYLKEKKFIKQSLNAMLSPELTLKIFGV